MRYTTTLLKTSKEDPKDEAARNAKYLIRGGFISKNMAGVYAYLPLGLRVLRKIENVVRSQMDQIGAELFLTSLSSKEYWTTTDRWDSIDVLYRVPTNHGDDIALNCTHEDNITPILKHFAQSPKDFPKFLYQIQTKFRNEARAKSGILRGREFLMKDGYSFHLSDECFSAFYDSMKEVYKQTFDLLGLGDRTFITVASGGDFTEKFSHEFQTLCDIGEDEVYYDKKNDTWWNKEVAPAIAPPIDEKDTEKRPREDVKGEGIIGVEELAKFFDIPVEKTTKTILFEDEKGQVIAAAVRGDYDVNEIKLKKILGCKQLSLASEETVRRVTGAEVGYAGILDLPDEVRVICDDSVGGRLNFECGANKTDYHSINVNFGVDLPEPEQFYDIKVAQPQDLNPETNKPYRVEKAAEVGNIFPLETKFPEAFDFKIDGKAIIMGSYGIGVSRLMGVIAEIFSDDKGLLWPEHLAPFTVYLAPIGKDDAVYEKADELYQTLCSSGIEVLYDDRRDKKTGPGQKFADHELLGIPYRVVLSEKLLAEGKAEIVSRKDGAVVEVGLDEIKETFLDRKTKA